jgi:hypothetical protein
MRMEKDLTIDEIAERLAISRQTIFYWVRDLPLQRPRRASAGQTLGNQGMRRKYKALRDEAYQRGCEEFDELARDPSFRDFVCMYIGEGYKRNRNTVAICNSDPRVVLLAARWTRRLAGNRVSYALQYHADQDLNELKRYWADVLGIDAADIRLQRKSNSNQLNGRTWRSEHGVLTVCSNDTYLRARLQAWMDRVRQEWLDSAA